MQTEKWLGGLSSSGFHLCGLNFKGAFRFKPGKPKPCRYQFTYAKFENKKNMAKPKGYEWEKVAEQGRWSLYRCEKDGRPVTVPNRRGLYLRNNSLLCLYAFLSSVLLLIAFGLFFWLTVYLGSGNSTNDEYFHRAIATVGVFALLLLANFVLFLVLSSANNRVLEMPGEAAASENAYRQFLNHKTFESWLERLLIKGGDITKRFCPLLIISPRELENWLSRMERRGYNVYKVHKTGAVFYFIKGAPRSVRYCVVNYEDEGISAYLSSGWQIVYTTTGRLGGFGRLALLSQAFEENSALPFRSGKDYMANAARIMLKYVIFYFALLVFFMALLFVFVFFKAAAQLTSAAAVLVLFCILLIAKMLFYFARSIVIARRGVYRSARISEKE
jgi:Protein of unknown function (DUF2812).